MKQTVDGAVWLHVSSGPIVLIQNQSEIATCLSMLCMSSKEGANLSFRIDVAYN